MITQSNFKNSNRGVSKISTVVSAFSPISSHSNYHLPRREVEDTKLILHLPLLHLELRQLNKITSFRKSPFSNAASWILAAVIWLSWIAHGDKVVASIPIKDSFSNLKFANFFKSN